MAKWFLLLGSLSGFLSVALGAFGAHALKTRFDDYQMGVYHTGVQYQFFHSFALALVGLLVLKLGNVATLKFSGMSFFFGICVFSGSLYLLAFTRIKILGAITPIGGLAFLIGWGLLSFTIAKANFN